MHTGSVFSLNVKVFSKKDRRGKEEMNQKGGNVFEDGDEGLGSGPQVKAWLTWLAGTEKLILKTMEMASSYAMPPPAINPPTRAGMGEKT